MANRDWLQKKNAHELARHIEAYYDKRSRFKDQPKIKCFIVEVLPPTKAWVGGSKIYCVRSTQPVRYV